MERPHHGALESCSHPRHLCCTSSSLYGHCNTIQMYRSCMCCMCAGMRELDGTFTCSCHKSVHLCQKSQWRLKHFLLVFFSECLSLGFMIFPLLKGNLPKSLILDSHWHSVTGDAGFSLNGTLIKRLAAPWRNTTLHSAAPDNSQGKLLS